MHPFTFSHLLGILFAHYQKNPGEMLDFPQKLRISFQCSPLTIILKQIYPNLSSRYVYFQHKVYWQKKREEIYKKLLKRQIKWINWLILWTTTENCVKVDHFPFTCFTRFVCFKTIFYPVTFMKYHQQSILWNDVDIRPKVQNSSARYQHDWWMSYAHLLR